MNAPAENTANSGQTANLAAAGEQPTSGRDHKSGDTRSSQTPEADGGKSFLAHLTASFGPYYLILGPKRKVINQAVFSRIIIHAAGLIYDTDTQTFYRQKPTEKSFEPITTPSLIDLMTKCLTNAAANDPVNFPVRELQLPRIKSLVEHIKTVAAITRTNARESLIEYLRDRLCLKHNCSLTVQEIRNDYLGCVRERNTSLLPPSKFHKELPRVMLERFNVTRTHNVLRPVPGTTRTTARRGFHGVAFKTDVVDAKDGRDASDEADGDVANPS
jgi:hypothetical protein